MSGLVPSHFPYIYITFGSLFFIVWQILYRRETSHMIMVPSCSFWNFWRRLSAEDVSPLMLCLSLVDAGASPFATCAACARAEAFCFHCSRNSGHSDSVSSVSLPESWMTHGRSPWRHSAFSLRRRSPSVSAAMMCSSHAP